MDRSYPYSRRLLARARLHKRMAAVAATVMVGSTVAFMLSWKPDPIASAMEPAAVHLALADGPATVRGVRRIYPYSVVPGGVSGQAELKRVIRTDRVVAAHYAEFDVDKARPVAVGKAREVYVSYRKGGQVFWTAHKVKLAEGETLLSDGRNEMRARCANRISDVAQYPVEPHRPAMEELDDAADLDEGEEYALGPDGLPVSTSGGIPRHTGQRGPGRGGASGISAPAATGQADTMLASSASSPSAGMSSAMGMSGSSSSTSNRPRPAATSPSTTTNPNTSGSDGSGGSSSGAQPPVSGGADPVPVPETETVVPVTPPEPMPDTGLPPVTTPPVMGNPDPAPQPEPELPVFTPNPLPQPGTPQSGGGSTEGQPPLTPPAGPGPLFPQPGGDTGPFIPKPDLNPPPPQESVEEPQAPADVPEPASIWLFGGALAVLVALRRRARITLGS
ncbi:PEP-CTERM motif-containing protein [Massilia sp. 9I]|nr:PEP-CTERM motif-containing protein [Massilia sp. 9I]